MLFKDIIFGFGEKCTIDENYYIFQIKIRFHQVTTYQCRSSIQTQVHLRYSIVIEDGLGFVLSSFIFAHHSQNCSFCMFTEHIHFPLHWLQLIIWTKSVNTLLYDIMLSILCEILLGKYLFYCLTRSSKFRNITIKIECWICIFHGLLLWPVE